MQYFVNQVVKWRLFCVALLGLVSCGGETEKPNSLLLNPTKTNLDSVSIYVIAGDYYELQIGVRGNELTGVYRDPAAKDKNACLFFFEGKIGTKNPVEVKCYNPTNTNAPFTGWFKILGDVMIARLNKTPMNTCEPEFTDAVGHSMVLDSQEEWSAVRMVQQRVDLLEDMDSEFTVGEPLDKGTIIAIREKRGAWLWVDVLNKQKDQGWIQEHTLYPLLE